jgi:hypothetical protein
VIIILQRAKEKPACPHLAMDKTHLSHTFCCTIHLHHPAEMDGPAHYHYAIAELGKRKRIEKGLC